MENMWRLINIQAGKLVLVEPENNIETVKAWGFTNLDNSDPD